ncbi:MAG: FMN-binding negative transcriptional regulator [Candidatus Cohnella colombiensis]|uniref:FMN-binding negative transcriptional regulator n=1 Tax=Candidatus Cohnella colombiensis TaxID=3121368 RepID=A0AA95JHT6_9BACL|nr:MAG: FMN-binding negative transcriptional regulator [Cohnella sp.]
MYIPKHFLVEDRAQIFDFINNNGFGILFSTHNNCPYASHLPFFLDKDEEYLYSHFARPNEQWKDIQGQNAMVVFTGPHSYISSSWYETNQSVPTWNYVAVHVYGRIEIINEQNEIINSLERLVQKYEEPNSPYKLDKSNVMFIEGLSRGIVTFKMKIDKLEGKWKLSQNHSEDRQRRVIERLEKSENQDAREISKLMRNNKKS